MRQKRKKQLHFISGKMAWFSLQLSLRGPEMNFHCGKLTRNEISLRGFCDISEESVHFAQKICSKILESSELHFLSTLNIPKM